MPFPERLPLEKFFRTPLSDVFGVAAFKCQTVLKKALCHFYLTESASASESYDPNLQKKSEGGKVSAPKRLDNAPIDAGAPPSNPNAAPAP